MKKVLALMALMLPVVAQGVSIQTIKMGWKSKVITNVPTGGSQELVRPKSQKREHEASRHWSRIRNNEPKSIVYGNRHKKPTTHYGIAGK
jgi:hypothetical protein